jgi:large subunit ribosomal protein L21
MYVFERGVHEMFAVIEQGGKQYKVAQGESLDIELTEVKPEAKTIELDKVLLISDGKDVKIGTPYIAGAKVIASFKTSAKEGVVKGDKIQIQYFRRRKNYNKKTGHRQKYLRVTIDKIES